MLLLMEGGFSSVEKKILQSRMAEGRREAHLSGKYLSGRSPMPYTYDKMAGGLVIDQQQIEPFKTVIRLAENHTIRQIADKTKLPFSRIRRIVADDRLLFY